METNTKKPWWSSALLVAVFWFGNVLAVGVAYFIVKIYPEYSTAAVYALPLLLLSVPAACFWIAWRRRLLQKGHRMKPFALAVLFIAGVFYLSSLYVYSLNVWPSLVLPELKEDPSFDESWAIRSVLLTLPSDSGYFIVDPTFGAHVFMPDELDRWLRDQRIVGRLSCDECNIRMMLDKLFGSADQQERLTVASSPECGYVVDWDGAFEAYFRKGAGGWEQLYQDHPKARGIVQVSRPIYDPDCGWFLVYIGVSRHWLSGYGRLVAYRIAPDSTLVEVNSVGLWIS